MLLLSKPCIENCSSYPTTNTHDIGVASYSVYVPEGEKDLSISSSASLGMVALRSLIVIVPIAKKAVTGAVAQLLTRERVYRGEHLTRPGKMPAGAYLLYYIRPQHAVNTFSPKNYKDSIKIA